MDIIQTPNFRRTVKRLHANQKKDLDEAVKVVCADPSLGDRKTGDLAGVQVYKFKMAKQLTLLAYIHRDDIVTLMLLALGTHENFCRDLKKSS